MSNCAKTIIVESPDRFARDLMVQLAGHDMLKARGMTLIAASAPMHFVEDTPTAVLVRQVLGHGAEFEKTTLVAKLSAAPDASASRPARRSRGARATSRRALTSSRWRRARPQEAQGWKVEPASDLSIAGRTMPPRSRSRSCSLGDAVAS